MLAGCRQSSRGLLLDVGCGPGSWTLPHVARAVGVAQKGMAMNGDE